MQNERHTAEMQLEQLPLQDSIHKQNSLLRMSSNNLTFVPGQGGASQQSSLQSNRFHHQQSFAPSDSRQGAGLMGTSFNERTDAPVRVAEELFPKNSNESITSGDIHHHVHHHYTHTHNHYHHNNDNIRGNSSKNTEER